MAGAVVPHCSIAGEPWSPSSLVLAWGELRVASGLSGTSPLGKVPLMFGVAIRLTPSDHSRTLIVIKNTEGGVQMRRFSAVLLAIGWILGGIGSASASEKQALIDDAISAAPDTITKNATIMDWSGNTLQKGTNGYTCFPTPPNLKGKAPMCLDTPWMAWADAWMKKKPSFKADAVGTAYMLAGDGGASNIDPFAEGPTADNQWIVEGPHLMTIVPDPAALEGIPTDPKNGGPFVMWKGTPYAHIMIPTSGK